MVIFNTAQEENSIKMWSSVLPHPPRSAKEHCLFLECVWEPCNISYHITPLGQEVVRRPPTPRAGGWSLVGCPWQDLHSIPRSCLLRTHLPVLTMVIIRTSRNDQQQQGFIFIRPWARILDGRPVILTHLPGISSDQTDRRGISTLN
jgi:hypothetical protein